MYLHYLKLALRSLMRQKGFTLVEVIVVMGIMAMFLVFGASLFKGIGGGESRDAVRNLILEGLTNAQTRALSSGQPVAFVMTPYEEGRVDQLGKSFTVFEVRQDDVTGAFTTGKQLRRWTKLPGRFIFSECNPVSTSGQNAFVESRVVSIPIKSENTKRSQVISAPAIVFGAAGNVIWPSGGGELELHIGEGVIQTGVVMGGTDKKEDWQKREIFVIGRQTGRARLLQIQ